MQRKHAFPGMFFIINERLCGPLYGSMFCAATILSSLPAPSFPPSPRPVNQRSWLSPYGRQSVISSESEASFSIHPAPYSCPLASSSSSISLSLGFPPPLPSLYSLCFPLWKSHLWSASAQRRVNFFKHGCHDAIRPGSLSFGRGRPGII